MTTEREDLEQLLKSPGWLRLREQQRLYWTEQISALIGRAVDDRDDVLALQKMRQVIAAKQATEQLLAWPAERLARMQAHTTTTGFEPDAAGAGSRRGPL